MPFRSRVQWLRLIVLATGAVALTPMSARLVAQTRQVSIDSLIYDLKSPDALRRQAAARELGAAKYRPATPDLVALAHDPVGAVRREVELSLERMEDIQALEGWRGEDRISTLLMSNETRMSVRTTAARFNLSGLMKARCSPPSKLGTCPHVSVRRARS